MKLSLLFAFILLITPQLAFSSPYGSRLLQGQWTFSRFLEFNNSACCAFRNLTFTRDQSPYYRGQLLETFVFDSDSTQNCQSLFGAYPNGFRIDTLGNLDYHAKSSTWYLPNGYTSEIIHRTDYTVMNGTDTLVVSADILDKYKSPQTISCIYVMTRVDDSSSFLDFIGRMATWKIGFMVIILLTCLGLICTRNPSKKEISKVMVQEDQEDFSQKETQRETSYHKQRNVY